MFSEIDRMNNSYQPKVIAVSYKSVIIAGHIDINTNMYWNIGQIRNIEF